MIQKWIVEGYSDFLDAAYVHGIPGFGFYASGVSPVTNVKLERCELLVLKDGAGNYFLPVNYVRCIYTLDGEIEDFADEIVPVTGLYAVPHAWYVLETGEIL